MQRPKQTWVLCLLRLNNFKISLVRLAPVSFFSPADTHRREYRHVYFDRFWAKRRMAALLLQQNHLRRNLPSSADRNLARTGFTLDKCAIAHRPSGGR